MNLAVIVSQKQIKSNICTTLVITLDSLLDFYTIYSSFETSKSLKRNHTLLLASNEYGESKFKSVECVLARSANLFAEEGKKWKFKLEQQHSFIKQ